MLSTSPFSVTSYVFSTNTFSGSTKARAERNNPDTVDKSDALNLRCTEVGVEPLNLLLSNYEQPDETPRLREGQIGLAGGAPGVNADVELDFATGGIVIVLSNLDPPVASRSAREIMSMVNSR